MLYVCMYVCMNAYMYVRTYVCRYVFVLCITKYLGLFVLLCKNILNVFKFNCVFVKIQTLK